MTFNTKTTELLSAQQTVDKCVTDVMRTRRKKLVDFFYRNYYNFLEFLEVKLANIC